MVLNTMFTTRLSIKQRLVVGFGLLILVTALSTGWVLSAAGRAIAYVPNKVGQALLHNERLTR